jgi:hypothetical protein
MLPGAPHMRLSQFCRYQQTLRAASLLAIAPLAVLSAQPVQAKQSVYVRDVRIDSILLAFGVDSSRVRAAAVRAIRDAGRLAADTSGPALDIDVTVPRSLIGACSIRVVMSASRLAGTWWSEAKRAVSPGRAWLTFPNFPRGASLAARRCPKWFVQSTSTYCPGCAVPDRVGRWQRSHGTRGGVRFAHVHRAVLFDAPQLKPIR